MWPGHVSVGNCLVPRQVRTNLSTREDHWQCSSENAKSWLAWQTTYGWWLGGPSQFWVVHQSIICWGHATNQNGPNGVRILLRHNGHFISVHLWNRLSTFILKFFICKNKESIVSPNGPSMVGPWVAPVDSWVTFGDRANVFQQHCHWPSSRKPLCCWLPELMIPPCAHLRRVTAGDALHLGQRITMELEVSDAVIIRMARDSFVLCIWH